MLANNKAAWTSNYISEISKLGSRAKAEASHYRHKDIKRALLEETNKKCAYCESKFVHVTYGDVEHIVAKTIDPQLVYDWDNLTIACDRCNTNKGHQSHLLDPYIDDIDSAIRFAGPLVYAAIGHDVGKATIAILKLNRTDLLERRAEKLDAIRECLENALHTKDVNSRKVLVDVLVKAAREAAAEYSACVTRYLEELHAAQHL